MFSVVKQLSEEKLLPLLRPLAVRRDLRGFEEEGSALRVAGGAKDTLVSITGLAARRCPTGRDLYLEKKKKLVPSSWPRSVLGKVVDKLLTELYLCGLDLVDTNLETDPSGSALIAADTRSGIVAIGNDIIDRIMSEEVVTKEKVTIEEFAKALFGADANNQLERTYQCLRTIVAHEAEVLVEIIEVARKRGEEWVPLLRWSLSMLQTGVKLDSSESAKASTFGLNPGVCPDFTYGVVLVGDLKADRYHSFYDLVAAGYAIFAEYVLRRRINYAILLLVEVDLGTPDKCTFNVVAVKIDDERRVAWSTQRDLAQTILRHPSLPAHPVDTAFCTDCLYRPTCWTGGNVGDPASV